MTSPSHESLCSPEPVMRDASGTPAREAFVCACCGREVVVKIERGSVTTLAGKPPTAAGEPASPKTWGSSGEAGAGGA
jgi:hypothetical protein